MTNKIYKSNLMHQINQDEIRLAEQNLSKMNGNETLSSEKERLNRDPHSRHISGSPIKSEIKKSEKLREENVDVRTKNAEYADSNPSSIQKPNGPGRRRRRSSVSSSASRDRIKRQKKKDKKGHCRHSRSRSSSEDSECKAPRKKDRKRNSRHKVESKNMKRKRSESSSFSSCHGSRNSSSDFERTLNDRKRSSRKADDRKDRSKRSKKQRERSRRRRKSVSSDSSCSRRKSSRRSSSSSNLPSPLRSDSIDRKHRSKKEIRGKYYKNIKTQENPLLLYKRSYAPVYQGNLIRMRP